MGDNLSINQEKSRVMALRNAAAVLLVAYLSFWFLSGICFGILDVACRLYGISPIKCFQCDWARFFYQPWYVFELYGNWWNIFITSIRLMSLKPVLFVPFMVPLIIIFVVVMAFIGQKYSFRLWYVLNYHFAKLKDIGKMGLNKEKGIILGKLGNEILGTKPTESVLCVGEMGTGKTSSVAIPSVLQSDDACIIAVDMSGLLPKYTAGHRARLGKVFYYNWDLLDDPEKKLFYPRWNPLAKDNLPAETIERDAYLTRIAGYLVNAEEEEKSDYWNVLAHCVIVSLLGYWVAKIIQAKANDYFLTKIIEGKKLNREEKDILLSYYIGMAKGYAQKAIENLENDTIDKNNYLPIGSWAGIPEQWEGKEACFAGITDWMIFNYIASHDNKTKDWRQWIESLLQEAVLFGYGKSVVNGLRKFLLLSAKQRQVAFAYIIKPFRIFTNQTIRERTNGNDFKIEDIRGIYDEKQKKLKPVTVYSMANTHASKILNQMFLDEVIYRNLCWNEAHNKMPLMLVLDDVGHNLKLKNLTALLTRGEAKKMSVLLLCNSLSLVANTYSREELECLVINTAYKIIKAPDNQKLSRQLDKLAIFATKSVQIPKNKNTDWKRNGKYFANAYYFHKLAQDFNLNKNLQIDTKNNQIVLVEGYYHRPILADNIFFTEDEHYRKLAVLDADYCLEVDKLRLKNTFMLETPKIAEIFNQKDLGVEDLVELDQYMNLVFEDVRLNIDEEEKKAKAKAKEEASVSIIAKEMKKNKESKKDWWLKEDAFKIYEKEDKNPFKLKK